MAIERFVLASSQTFDGFGDLMKAFAKEKENLKPYVVLIICSILSFFCFLFGTIQAVGIILRF